MTVTTEPATVAFWNHVWEETSRLVAEASEILACHLREIPLGVRNLSREPWHGAGELRVGRTTFRLECPLVSLPPAPDETELAATFGEETPLARLLVYRDSSTPAPEPCAWLVADPATGRWIAGPGDLVSPTPAARHELERFLWGLMLDPWD